MTGWHMALDCAEGFECQHKACCALLWLHQRQDAMVTSGWARHDECNIPHGQQMALMINGAEVQMDIKSSRLAAEATEFLLGQGNAHALCQKKALL